MEGHGQLRVHVVGGGPAGLVTAINLAEWAIAEFGERARALFFVVVSDTRFQVSDDDTVILGDPNPAPGTRHGQVVTLHDDCLESLSAGTRALVLRYVDEKAWSATSRNIPLRELEHRLVERAHDPAFSGLVALRAMACPPRDNDREGVRAFRRSLCDGFHIMVGADGPDSWVRQHLLGVPDVKMQSCGTDLALSVSFEVPEGRHQHGLPLPQADNVVRTVAQRRFRLSASVATRGGFLDISVSPAEFAQAKRCDGHDCIFAHSPARLYGDAIRSCDPPPADAFQPERCARMGIGAEAPARLWQTLSDGLRLFGIEEQCVTGVGGLRVNVPYSPSVVGEYSDTASDEPREYKSRVVAVVGDAAFQPHFWPGRGTSCEIKEAGMLAYALFSAKAAIVALRSDDRRIKVNLVEFVEYAAFMQQLRDSEYSDRSLRYECPRGGSALLDSASRMPDFIEQAISRSERSEGALLEHAMGQRLIAEGLGLDDAGLQEVAERLRQDLQHIGDVEVQVMALSGEWPPPPAAEILPLGHMCTLARSRRRAEPAAPTPPDAPRPADDEPRPLADLLGMSHVGAQEHKIQFGTPLAQALAVLLGNSCLEEEQGAAAGALRNIVCHYPDVCHQVAAVAHPDVVEALQRLAINGCAVETQAQAVDALASFARGPHDGLGIAAVVSLAQLPAHERSGAKARKDATILLQELATGGSDRIANAPGAAEALVRMAAKARPPEAQAAAVDAMWSLAFRGTPETAQHLAGVPGALEALGLQVAEGVNPIAQRRAALALGELADRGDGAYGPAVALRVAALPGRRGRDPQESPGHLLDLLARQTADPNSDVVTRACSAEALRRLAGCGGPELKSRVTALPGLAEALQELASQGESAWAKGRAEDTLEVLSSEVAPRRLA